MMFNSRNLGALIVDEDPHVKSWEDGQYNIMNMSIEETYGFACATRDRLLRAGIVSVLSDKFVMPARTVHRYSLLDRGSLFPRPVCRFYTPLPGGRRPRRFRAALALVSRLQRPGRNGASGSRKRLSVSGQLKLRKSDLMSLYRCGNRSVSGSAMRKYIERGRSS